MRPRSILIAVLLTLFLAGLALAEEQEPQLSWQPWSDGVFAQARAEHKFVLLDLEAVRDNDRVLAIFRHQCNAGIFLAIFPKNALEQFRSPRSDQPAQPNDLAPAQIQRDIARQF